MRRILFALALSAAVIASVRAQTLMPDGTTVTVGNSRLSNMLEAYHTDWFSDQWTEQLIQRLDGNGELTIPAAIFEGAATLPVVEMRCAATPNQRKLLLPTSRAGVAELEQKLLSSSLCSGDCSCKPLKRMRFREDYTYTWTPKPFYSRPEFVIPAAGGTIGGIILATNGSDGEDGTSNPNSPELPANLLGDYRLSALVQQRSACNYNNFSALVTFSGTQGAFNIRVAELVTKIYTGTAQFGADAIQFSTNGAGTIPGLGNYSSTFIGQILANGSATGTETMTLPCGLVLLIYSGNKQ